jgi:hypothetical protein
MLISEKRQTGFQEVVNKIRRFGAHRREASVADFLVLQDPLGCAEDSRDLERPRGLPKLHRGLPSMKLASGQPAGMAPGGQVTMLPSAAQGIGAYAPGLLVQPTGETPSPPPTAGTDGRKQQSWGAATESDLMAQAHHRWDAQAEEPQLATACQEGTGRVIGNTGATFQNNENWCGSLATCVIPKRGPFVTNCTPPHLRIWHG